jgi:hypothetical protein
MTILYVTQGRPFSFLAEINRDAAPVDMTQWTGVFRVKEVGTGNLIGEWSVDLSEVGTAEVSIEETDAFPSYGRIGAFATAAYEMDLVEPDGPGVLLQGAVAVTGKI